MQLPAGNRAEDREATDLKAGPARSRNRTGIDESSKAAHNHLSRRAELVRKLGLRHAERELAVLGVRGALGDVGGESRIQCRRRQLVDAPKETLRASGNSS